MIYIDDNKINEEIYRTEKLIIVYKETTEKEILLKLEGKLDGLKWIRDNSLTK